MRIVVLEAGQVFGASAAPGIDGLIVVADHGEGSARSGELAHQLILSPVGVLILVDQQITDAPLPALQDVRVRPEQAHRPEDQGVEVHRVVGVQAALIVRIEPGDLGLVGVLGAAQGRIRRDQVVLPARDPLRDGRRVDRIRIDGAAQVLLDQRLAVLGIEQRKARAQAGRRVLAAQDVLAQGVEGGDGKPPTVAALQFPGHPLAHLPRRLVGEGDGANVAGGNPAGTDQMGDLAGDDAGLAGAGTGQHQEGTGGVADRLVLFGVESVHPGIAPVVRVKPTGGAGERPGRRWIAFRTTIVIFDRQCEDAP